MKRYPDKLSLYLPVSKNEDLVGRLKALAKRLDRSVNYLIIEAIVQFLEREERKIAGHGVGMQDVKEV